MKSKHINKKLITMKYILGICVVYIIFSITLFNEASTRTLNISSEREREREREREGERERQLSL